MSEDPRRWTISKQDFDEGCVRDVIGPDTGPVVVAPLVALQRSQEARREDEAMIRHLSKWLMESDMERYRLAAEVERLKAVVRVVNDEVVRDPTPHSSAWLVPAGAMDLVRNVLAPTDGETEND